MAGGAKRRLVSSWGEIWSITEAGWHRWLMAQACGKAPRLGDFGGREIGYAKNITDMSPLDAKLELEFIGHRDARSLVHIRYDDQGFVVPFREGDL